MTTGAAGSAPLAGRRIGFVGAGRIGSPMAQRLAGAGAEVTVYARRADVRDELAAKGCRTVASLAELGTDNDLVISCLFSDGQFESVADELAGRLAPGSVFVSHTTGSPATVQAFAERLADRDVQVVDAPFSGTPEHILDGTLTVLLGGAPDAVERVEAAVRSYAATVIHTGDLGSALVLKLLNNVVFAANVQLGLEVARLTKKAGIPMSVALEVLENSSGGTRALSYLSTFASAAEYAAQTRPFLVKDVAVCEAVAETMGLDLGLLGTVVRDGPLDLSRR
jgi:3-hydroxyisobutyrate dehydrogenase-like beta-hydroxyacid dehydrogenase